MIARIATSTIPSDRDNDIMLVGADFTVTGHVNLLSMMSQILNFITFKTINKANKAVIIIKIRLNVLI